MPNWCQNTLTLHGNKSDRAKFSRDVETHDKDNKIIFLSMSKVVPPPRDLVVQKEADLLCDEIPRRYDDPNIPLNAYEWEHINWGCKWGASDTFRYETTRTTKYIFYTPWSPPCAFVLKVSSLYPNIKFMLKYSELSNGILGKDIFYNGRVISGHYSDKQHITMMNIMNKSFRDKLKEIKESKRS